MDLRHLRYFDALASTLNFSRAAELLHMSQPPLSRAIRELETEVGAELVTRGRPLALTHAGRFFHDQSTQILRRLDELQQATKRMAQGKRGWFGIGFVPSTLYGVLPELIRMMRAEHDDFEVGLQELTTIQQAEALLTGRIDVGFGRLHLSDPAIACQVIMREPLVVALSRRHPLSKLKKLSLARIAPEPLILYPARPRPSYADRVLEIFRDHRLVPNVVLEANELQTAVGLVSAGIGIALVPASVQRLHRDDVLYVPLSDAKVHSPLIMNSRADDNSEGLTAFRALVMKAVPQMEMG